jgi:8-oxo-dGTP pyrophosphatase MutT (NUDIX family)
MSLFKTAFHPDISPQQLKQTNNDRLLIRHAARGIVLRGEMILLLFTQKYHDYSLPGGGIDEGEDKIPALIRELEEETGAQGVRNIIPFACYEEYRPWYKDNADIIHMISHCYLCDIDEKLGETSLEQHEINNGMTPHWINIYDAIAHNEDIIKNSDKKGLSIVRETFLLKAIVEKLLEKEGVQTRIINHES